MKKVFNSFLCLLTFIVLFNELGAQTIEIGSGTSTQKQPLGIEYGYERSVSIYTSAEIGQAGTISRIAWYPTIASIAPTPVKIYMRNSAVTNMSATTWNSIFTGATLVYDGIVTFSANSWNIINLATPFAYNGTNNLQVLVETNYGLTGTGTSVGSAFKYSTATSKHQYWQANTTPPTNSGTVNAQRPNIQISFGPAAPIDLTVSSLVTPLSAGCYTSNETVSFDIKNIGSDPIDMSVNNVTIGGQATGVNPITFPPVVLNSGVIAAGATQNVTLSLTYNMSVAGTYNFRAWAKTTVDPISSNDTIAYSSRTVVPSVSLPLQVNFTGFTGANLTTLFPGWYEATGALSPTGTTSAWANASGLGGVGNVSAKINMNSNTKREWIVGPKIIPSIGTDFKFDVAITNAGSTTQSDIMGGDDAVYLMISNTCGLTWAKIDSFTVADMLTVNLITQTYSLATYAGQEIILAFFANEGIIDNAEDYDFHIDNIITVTALPVDIAVQLLNQPLTTGCYSSNQNVSLRIKNVGLNTLDLTTDNITFGGSVSGTNPTIFTNQLINSGSLAQGAFIDVDLISNFDMSASGNYNFKIWAKINGDSNAGNDTLLQTRTLAPNVALPLHVDFTGFTGANLSTVFSGWYEATGELNPTGTTSAWSNATGLGTTGNVTAKINMSSNTKREWIIGPKFIPFAGTDFIFDAAVTAAGSTSTSGTMGSDDAVVLMISNTCGQSWLPLDTLNTSDGLNMTLTSKSYNLGAYAGQPVILAFFATEGAIDNTENFDFHIDNIRTITILPVDIGAELFNQPTAGGCYGANQTIGFRIKNYGLNTLDLSASNIIISGFATGANPTVFPDQIIATGTLMPGGFIDVVLNSTYNMSSTGTYNFKCWAKIASDPNANNDSISQSRTLAPNVTLPIQVNFTGFTGANLTTMFPGWYEATGNFPAGSTSLWTSQTGVGGTGNITARVNLSSNTKREWIIGPKFIPTSGTNIDFDVAVTNANSTNVAGIMGGDDAVFLMISTNCGLSWEKIDSFTVADNLTASLSPQSYNLGSYAGQQIILAFFATSGIVANAQNYDFHIDNINTITVLPIDVGVELLNNPLTTGCYYNNEIVSCRIRNYGFTAIDLSTEILTVGGRVTGPNPITFPNVIINSGIIPVGAYLDVVISNNYNMLSSGSYIFKCYARTSSDPNANNDTMAVATRIVSPSAILPQNVNFTGYTGANLSAQFPGWSEATGAAAPSGTSSSWINASNLGLTGNISAKVNLSAVSRKEWILGPKINAVNGARLTFYAAVTETSSIVLRDTMGSDDALFVMVSNNCGVSWSKLDSIKRSNLLSPTLTPKVINLSQFAGQQIIIGFLATDGVVDDIEAYDLHLDNIGLAYQPGNDVAITEILGVPDIIGEGLPLQIKAVIKNVGTTQITNMSFTVTHNNANPVNTAWSGSLFSGQIDTVTISNSYAALSLANNICIKANLPLEVDSTNNLLCKNYFGNPVYDAGITSFVGLAQGCNLTNQPITVRIKNFGSGIILNNLSVTYVITPGGLTKTENVNTSIPVNGTYDYTFVDLVDFIATNDDVNYCIKAYTNIIGDVIHTNDTNKLCFTSFATPENPIPDHENVSYGDRAVLQVFSGDPISWYTSPSASNPIHLGMVYQTPPLYRTTNFYAQAKYPYNPPFTSQIGTGTQSNVPMNGSQNFTWASTIYSPFALGFPSARRIDTIGFQLNNNVNNFTTKHQRIYMVPASDTIFYDLSQPDPLLQLMTKVYDGPITWNGTGWFKIPLQTPYEYDGLSGIWLYWENLDSTAIASGTPVFASHNVVNNTKYKSSSTLPFSGDGTNSVMRPNIYFSTKGGGCGSDRIAVTGFVSNIPSIDVAVNDYKINSGEGVYSSTDTVKVLIKNQGLTNISNIPIKYQIDNGVIVSEVVNLTLVPEQEVWFKFSQTADFSNYGTNYKLKMFHSYAGDSYISNDTLNGSFYNTVFGFPYSNDFETVTVGWYDTTYNGNTHWQLGKPAFGVTNTTHSGLNSFDLNLTAAYGANSLCYLYTPKIDFRNIFDAKLSFWHNYKLESNNDGVRIEYNVPSVDTDWRTLGSVGDPNGTNWYNSTISGINKPGWSGNSSGWKNPSFNLPMLNDTGLVQFRFVFNSNSTTQQDGYSIDDVVLSYPLPGDAGITSVTLPTTTLNEFDSIPVQVVIKNFGTTPITSMNLIVTHNGVTVGNEVWIGTLAAGASITDTLITKVVANQATNTICVATAVAGDINTFNDQSCKNYTANPKWNAGTTGIIATASGCSLANQVIQVKIKNYAWGTINGNLSATYTINYKDANGNFVTYATVTEPVPQIITPNNTITYTFNTLADFPSPTQDSNYVIKAFPVIAGDLIATNDTSTKSVKSFYTPPIPTPRDAIIYYGNVANLRVLSGALVKWYANSVGGTSIKDGLFYTTPVLYDTACYFAEAYVIGATATCKSLRTPVCAYVINIPNKDVGVTNLTTTKVSNYHTANDSVKVQIRNFGPNTASDIPVKYQINNGPIVTDTFFTTLNIGESKWFKFKYTANLYEGGMYSFKAYTDHSLDIYHVNDTFKINVPNDVYNLPYGNYFDISSLFWKDSVSSANTKWQLGMPNFGNTSSAHSGSKAWDTNLDSAYGASATSYLYTPRFNFKGVKNGTLAFWHNYYTEPASDGLRIQYSNNGGAWQELDTINNDNRGVNWYNTLVSASSKRGWSGSSGGWQLAKISLPSLNVAQFRFVFNSNTSINLAGHSIDDFSIIIPPPFDAGITNITQPVTSVLEGNAVNPTVTLKNFGINNLTNVLIKVVLNNTDTLSYNWSGNLTTGQTANVNIPGFIAPRGKDTLCAFTLLPNDTVPANDKFCKPFFGIPRQQFAISNLRGISEGCGLGNQYFTCTIKSIGVDTIPADSMRISFTEYFSPYVTTETIHQALAPGSTLEYTFVNPMNLGTTDVDTTWRVWVYGSLYRDVVNSDDTLIRLVKSYFVPTTPMVNNPEIPYGDEAILTSYSNGNVYWYNNSTNTSSFFTGNELVIPILYDTVTYWVQAINSHVGPDPIGSGSTTQRQPFGYNSGFERSAALYLNYELGSAKSINRIAWYPTILSTQKIPVKIYLKEVSNATLTASTWSNLISGATLVFNDSIKFSTINKWVEVGFSTAFNINNAGNLLVLVETNVGGTGGGTTSGNGIKFTASTSMHQVWSGNTFPPGSNGTVNANRPNIWFGSETCSSERVTNTAFVKQIPSHDVGLLGVSVIPNGGLYTESNRVKVYVKNFLNTTIDTIPIRIAVDGVEMAIDTIFTPIVGKDSMWINLDAFVDLRACGKVFSVAAYTAHDLDYIRINDTAKTSIISSYQCVPYGTNLEFNNLGWRDSTNNAATKWVWGVPNFGATNSAHSGYKAYDVNLTTAYGANSMVYLYTPRFDFRNLPETPKIGFWHNYKTEQNQDGVRLEYSFNGVTWTRLGNRNDLNGTNWYNTTIGSPVNQDSWTGNSNGWVYSEYRMTALNDSSRVEFRFVFRSNGSNQQDGYSIDDFSVFYPLEKDAGATEFLNPYHSATDTMSQFEKSIVRMKIKNFGMQTIFALDSLHAMYSINGIPKDTMLVPGDIAPGQTITVTFPDSLIMPGGLKTYCGSTILNNDINVFNDGTCKDVFSYPQKDLLAVVFVKPLDMVSAYPGNQVQIRIKNNSTLDTVVFTRGGYRISTDTYTGPVIEGQWLGSLVPGATATFTFNQPFTAPAGKFRITAWVNYDEDGKNSNDTISKEVTGIYLFRIPYVNNFEGFNYFAKGATSSWQHGVPTASTIHTPHSPVKVWKTNLPGNYNANARDTLYTPRFIFSKMNNPKLKFWHWVHTESGKDGCCIQFSFNGGPWGMLGYKGDPNGTNWYNSFVNRDCWSGQSSGWSQVIYDFDDNWSSSANSVIQFRFILFADDQNQFNGWAIDDFEITVDPIPVDAGVTSILLPTGAIHAADTQQVTIAIKNFGTDALTSVPVRYRINSGQLIQGTCTETILPGQTVQYTFPTSFVAPNNNFTITSFTRLAPTDVYSHNDTCKRSYFRLPPRYDAGVVEIVTPSDSTYYKEDVEVQVVVKNFGTDPVTYIPVNYHVTGFDYPTTEVILDTIQPDSTYIYKFNYKYKSDSANYMICSFTNLNGDIIYTNDSTCKQIHAYVGFDEIVGEPLYLYQNIPNPANNSTMIMYSIPKIGKVQFVIRDMYGKPIYKFDKMQAAGKGYVDLDLSNIPAGLYFYTLQYNNQMLTRRMVIVK